MQNKTTIGGFNFGYLAYTKNSLIVYPMVGFGWGGTALSIEDKINETKKELNNSQFFLQTELNIDVFSHFNLEEKTISGIKTGLSIGYLFNANSERWRQGKPETYIPNASTEGFYIKITLGGGGFRSSLSKSPNPQCLKKILLRIC